MRETLPKILRSTCGIDEGNEGIMNRRVKNCGKQTLVNPPKMTERFSMMFQAQ